MHLSNHESICSQSSKAKLRKDSLSHSKKVYHIDPKDKKLQYYCTLLFTYHESQNNADAKHWWKINHSRKQTWRSRGETNATYFCQEPVLVYSELLISPYHAATSKLNLLGWIPNDREGGLQSEDANCSHRLLQASKLPPLTSLYSNHQNSAG